MFLFCVAYLFIAERARCQRWQQLGRIEKRAHFHPQLDGLFGQEFEKERRVFVEYFAIVLLGESVQSFLVVLLLDVVGDYLGVVLHDLGEVNHVGDVAVAGEYLVDGVLALVQTLLDFGALEKARELVVQRVVVVERFLVRQVGQLA